MLTRFIVTGSICIIGVLERVHSFMFLMGLAASIISIRLLSNQHEQNTRRTQGLLLVLAFLIICPTICSLFVKFAFKLQEHKISSHRIEPD